MNKTVKKVLWIVVIVVVLLTATVIVGLTLFGNQALKKGVEYGASTALKVGVTLDSANLSILGGNVELNGLKVNNPSGYQHDEFLTMGKAAVSLNTKSLLSDTIEIKKIQLEKIQLILEQKGVTTNNLQEILSSLPKSDRTTPSTQQESGGKQLHIKELVINEVEVKVKLLPVPGKVDTLTLPLDKIELKDLGSNKPINVAELTAMILQEIAKGVTKSGKDKLPLDMVNSIGADLTKQGQKIIDSAGEAGKGVLDGVGGALKGILQKKED